MLWKVSRMFAAKCEASNRSDVRDSSFDDGVVPIAN
jgi:hypothetical protein